MLKISIFGAISMQFRNIIPIYARMIERHLLRELSQALQKVPVVCLLGPRQVGKTTLARETLAIRKDSLYLDLESEQDRAKLSDPERYLELHQDELVVLDEVHRVPGLFPVLRGIVDENRRRGVKTGTHLLLGSASPDLLKQSGETLAGRVRYLELTPLSVLETPHIATDTVWLRGGFPESLLAADDAESIAWRRDFIRTYLERDIPQFGPRVAAETLRRFWIMLAHRQGAPLNAAELARSMGMDAKTIGRYLDLLTDLFLVRRLPPWHANVGKRLMKSPRVYLRDSGLLHTLLGIGDMDSLLSHPVLGASWEGFVIETLLGADEWGKSGSYYRTSGGAEIDLLLELPGGERWAIEVKRGAAGKPARGFYEGCEDVKPTRRFVVYPGDERYPLAHDVEAVPLPVLAEEVRKKTKR